MEQEFHESAIEHIQAVIESEEISPGVSRVLKHGKRVARSKLTHELLSTGKYAHIEFNDATEIAVSFAHVCLNALADFTSSKLQH
jgi:hypothetical protein